MPTPARKLFLLLPLLLWVMGFGVIGAVADTLWFDEFWSLFNAGGVTYEGVPRDVPLDLKSTWFQIRDIDPIHPPGYAFALAIWSRLTGWNAFSGRMMSVLLGVLAVAMMYRTGHDLFSEQVGLVAAYLLGTSAFFIHYYHEMRMYTLLVLLVCTAIWSYWRLIHYPVRLFAATVFVVSLAGLVYTQYLSLFVAIGIGVYHLLFVRKDRRWLVIAGLAIAAGLLYIPWLSTALNMFLSVTGGPSRAGVLSTPAILQGALAIFSNSLLTTTTQYLISFVPVFAVLLVLSLFPDHCHSGRNLSLTVFVVTGALMVVINAQTGMFIHIRYLLVMFPPLMLLMAAGVERLVKSGGSFMPLIIIGLWMLSGFATYADFEAKYNRDAQWTLPWTDITSSLAGLTTSDDLIVVQTAENRTWWDYAQVAAFYTYDIPARVTLTPLRPYESDVVFREQWQDEQFNGQQRIFSVWDKTQSANTLARFESILQETHVLCHTLVDTATLHIDMYAADESLCDVESVDAE